MECLGRARTNDWLDLKWRERQCNGQSLCYKGSRILWLVHGWLRLLYSGVDGLLDVSESFAPSELPDVWSDSIPSSMLHVNISSTKLACYSEY